MTSSKTECLPAQIRTLKPKFMNCAIWTEDPSTGENIKAHLEQWSSFLTCHELSSTADMLPEKVTADSSDVHFVMLESSSSGALEHLGNCNQNVPLVVFIVSPTCKFIRNIEASALDYMCWPFNMHQVREMERRLKDLQAMREECPEFSEGYAFALKFLATNIRKHSIKEVIIPNVRGYRACATHELIRFESDGPYSYAFISNGEQVLTNKPLKHFEYVLDNADFVRIQNSHMINLHYLKSWQSDKGVRLTLADGSSFEVSFRWVPLFVQAFTKWSKKRGNQHPNT